MNTPTNAAAMPSPKPRSHIGYDLGSFGSTNSADPHEAGKKGARAQSTADKRKGGEHSHGGGRRSQG